MSENDQIFLGASKSEASGDPQAQTLLLRFANRHGLVTGATGTGKTVTLQVLAEGFSDAGVPVFCADIKGDLSGIAAEGTPKDFLVERAAAIGLEPYYNDHFPSVFFDLFGEKGHPVRATVSEMGPLLLSRMMDLSEAQEGVLNVVFRLADDEGLLLLDLKDLQAMLTHVAENAEDVSRTYGLVSKASVGAIQRQLLILENQGADGFFGEPALRIEDLLLVDREGRGVVSILAAEKLATSPRLYSTFLLWLLSELFEDLPEVGDVEKPKLVFFFDEAHLLFTGAPKAFVERVEQVVRLIRSKGVGVYFVTQNPLDLPETVLAQLGNRIQHALRAYTPREERAVRTAAATFRPNPTFDSARAITELGVGEALVSTLGDGGVPSIVQRTLIRPPAGRIGPIDESERAALVRASPIAGRYDTAVDRESAYEMLTGRAEAEIARETETRAAETAAGEARSRAMAERADAARRRAAEKEREPERRLPVPDFDEDEDEPAPRTSRSRGRAAPSRSGYQRQGLGETVMKQVGRTLASTVTREILRGLLGGMKRGR